MALELRDCNRMILCSVTLFPFLQMYRNENTPTAQLDVVTEHVARDVLLSGFTFLPYLAKIWDVRKDGGN